MMAQRPRLPILPTIGPLIFVFLVGIPVQAQYTGGAGTADDPYRIATAVDLIALGETPDDYDKHFILTADIDLDPNLPGGRVFSAAVIGPPEAPGFSGTFDGRGHAIAHVVIAAPDGNDVGLFGRIERSATVKDLHLERISVTGGNTTGGLCAANDGTIVSCTSSGVVQGRETVGHLVGRNNGGAIYLCWSEGDVLGKINVGGLVGYGTYTCYCLGSSDAPAFCSNDQYMTGEIRSSGSVANVRGEYRVGGLVGANDGCICSCRTGGDISGASYVGGLVGRNGDSHSYWGLVVVQLCPEESEHPLTTYRTTDWSGRIDACYSTARVEGQNYVGGLAGANEEGVLYSCYATGSVNGSADVGGLVGGNAAGVEYCYAAALVQVEESEPFQGPQGGGLIGRNSGSVHQSFWDTDRSGCLMSDGGFGRATRQMQKTDTYRCWGAAGSWTIDDGHDYPRLAWEELLGTTMVPCVCAYGAGTGEPNDPYQIWSAEQLTSLVCHRDDYDKHFALMTDIDLGALDPNLILPIGAEGCPFTGVFDGRSQTIRNFRYVHPGDSQVGLFGVVGGPDADANHPGGIVKDLRLVDVNVIGYDHVGALAGQNAGTLLSCTVSGHVEGHENVGGLAGLNDNVIDSCTTDTWVIGRHNVGGLVGRSGRSGFVLYLPDPFNVHTFKFVYVLEGSVIDSHSQGYVQGASGVGGLVGGNGGTVSSCSSMSQAHGEDSVGGLVGANGPSLLSTGGPVYDSYADGIVIGNWDVGGLVGSNFGGRVMGCYATGTVHGVGHVGGLAGAGLGVSGEEGLVAACYSTSTVIGEQDVGGLIGLNDYQNTIVTSYWAGTLQGQDNTGALVGANRGQILLSYWDAEASRVDVSAGGEPKTTTQLMSLETFRGWGYLGRWTLDEGRDYPRFHWQGLPGEPIVDDPCRYEYGTGTADDPYQIHGAPQLAVIGQHPADYDKHFLLATDIDMTAMGADDILPIGIPGMPFSGTFDGNGHTIKGFRLAAPDLDLVGLFGAVGHSGPDPNDPCGTVIDVKLADVDICGRDFVGGLAGANSGTIERCATDGRVAGRDGVGGLVGVNGWDRHATVRNCHSSASVTASAGCAGGFAGANSTLSVIEQCYSCGPVSAAEHLSGFIGVAGPLPVSGCFWDVDTAGAGETLADPNSGTGLPTSEMWRASPYLEAGWDFVGEVENGTKDIWWILEGQDYPRLWWELGNEASPS